MDEITNEQFKEALASYKRKTKYRYKTIREIVMLEAYLEQKPIPGSVESLMRLIHEQG